MSSSVWFVRISSLLLAVSLFTGCNTQETPTQSKGSSKPEGSVTEMAIPSQRSAEAPLVTPSTENSGISDVKTAITAPSSTLIEIKDQSFDVNFETWGDVRFVSAKDNSSSSLVLSIKDKEGKTLYTLPKPKYVGSWSFDSIKAVSFRDIDYNGKKDVIVIASYLVDTDKGTKTPMDVVSIFLQMDKAFITDFTRDVRVNASSKVQTIKDVVDRLNTLDALSSNPLTVSDKGDITLELVNKALCSKVLSTDMTEKHIASLYYNTYDKYHMGMSERGQDEMYGAIGSCFDSETETLLRGRPALKMLTDDLFKTSVSINADLMTLGYHLSGGGTLWGHMRARTYGLYGYRMNQYVKLKINDPLDAVQYYDKSIKIVNSLLADYKKDTIDQEATNEFIKDKRDVDNGLIDLDSHVTQLEKLLSAKDIASVYLLKYAALNLGGTEDQFPLLN